MFFLGLLTSHHWIQVRETRDRTKTRRTRGGQTLGTPAERQSSRFCRRHSAHPCLSQHCKSNATAVCRAAVGGVKSQLLNLIGRQLCGVLKSQHFELAVKTPSTERANLRSRASEDMRRIVFDSSSDEDVEEEQLTPLHISWLPLSIVECSQYLGICALPGCRYRDVRRSLQRDVDELKNQGVQNVFVFCTRGELSKYRVPSLLEVYDQHGFTVHHAPFPDGDVPELEQCCQILTELQVCLERNRKTVVHCYGGLGRSALIAACLLLELSVTMTADKAIEILREHRGVGAIQTVKQYNFLHEFREKYTAYKESREAAPERSVSR